MNWTKFSFAQKTYQFLPFFYSFLSLCFSFCSFLRFILQIGTSYHLSDIFSAMLLWRAHIIIITTTTRILSDAPMTFVFCTMQFNRKISRFFLFEIQFISLAQNHTYGFG